MSRIPDIKIVVSSDGETKSVTARARPDGTRLRDFCKAKAEVLSFGETTRALREFLNPFKQK